MEAESKPTLRQMCQQAERRQQAQLMHLGPVAVQPRYVVRACSRCGRSGWVRNSRRARELTPIWFCEEGCKQWQRAVTSPG